jgi:acetyl esterase/lipase
MRVRYSHLNIDSPIRDVIAHPAFAGFGRLILPWDDRNADDDLRVRDISRLLPYHSEVNPLEIVAALNRMIDDANGGQTVFYDFYTEAEKKAEPTKRNTGIFFFRGKPGAPFAIVCPGGGFSYVASLHEGFPYAAEISKRGYNAFVLKYRAGLGGGTATHDLAAALSYVLRNAETLGVGVRDYSLWGSSAGARMAASIGSHGAAFYGGDTLPRPSIVVMAYTGHSEVSSCEPPTFAVVGEQDGIAPPYVMERRISALRKAGTPVEFHKFKNVGHGFGLGTGTSAEGWIGIAIRFWRRFIR